MATVEVWTVGGGEYIVNVFNAVAAWTGQGGYKSLIQAVMVMGFAMACVTIAFDSDWRAWINWFLQATLMYLCLMVPRVDVQVTDRINPGLAPSFVANVPLGLGLMASFTSQVGDYLTTSAEVVFGLPNDLNYSTNGMVYGARLYQATQGIQFNDAEFATNLDEHMHNCVFYDVLLGHKSMGSLASAPDLWAAIGPGSPARAQKFLTLNGDGTVSSAIVTCQTAYNTMTSQLSATGGPLDKVTEPLSRSLYPKLLPAVAKAKLLADLGGAYSYLTGVSAAASDVMKQSLMINAMSQAMHTMPAAAGGSPVDVYAQTRAEIQTRNTYSSIAQAAMKWVPLLHIVLTVMFYALFPVLFPLFLMPRTGVPALKGYVTGFFYLAAWGPLFVILHMIMMFKGAGDMSAVANGTGATLFSYAGISGVTDDVALLAGYLIASVPFIAGGVAKGAMAISSNATSFLQPSQNAAEVAANEASTGNIALGGTSLDNQTTNMRQSNNWSDAASYTTGASAFNTRGNDGYMTHSYPGSEVGDASGAMSRLAVTPTLSQDLQSSFTTSATAAKARSETLSNTAAASFSSANTQAAEFRNATTAGSTLDRSIGSDDRATLSNVYSQIDNAATALQSKFGFERSKAEAVATEKFFNGQVSTSTLGGGGTSGGGGGRGLGLPVGGSVNTGYRKGVTESGSVSGSDSLSQAKDFLDQYGRSNSWGSQKDAFDKISQSSSNGTLASKANTVSAAYSRANSASEEARKSYDQSQRLEHAASLREGNSVGVSENDSQRFAQFANREIAVQRAGGMTPAWRGPTTELASTPEQLKEQAGLIQKFVASERQRIADGVEPRLVEPSSGGIVRPSANTQTKVHALAEGGIGALQNRGLPYDANVPSAATNYTVNRARLGAVAAGAARVEERVDNRQKAFAKVTPTLSPQPQTTLDNVIGKDNRNVAEIVTDGALDALGASRKP